MRFIAENVHVLCIIDFHEHSLCSLLAKTLDLFSKNTLVWVITRNIPFTFRRNYMKKLFQFWLKSLNIFQRHEIWKRKYIKKFQYVFRLMYLISDDENNIISRKDCRDTSDDKGLNKIQKTVCTYYNVHMLSFMHICEC